MQDEPTRVMLSLRLGAGLGLVYALLFAAVRMNVSSIPKAYELALVMLIVLVGTGYIWINHKDTIISRLTDNED